MLVALGMFSTLFISISQYRKLQYRSLKSQRMWYRKFGQQVIEIAEHWDTRSAISDAFIGEMIQVDLNPRAVRRKAFKFILHRKIKQAHDINQLFRKIEMDDERRKRQLLEMLNEVFLAFTYGSVIAGWVLRKFAIQKLDHKAQAQVAIAILLPQYAHV
jgi:hypothetical protein